MADISYYWQNKSLRALQANQHTEIMAHQCPKEIEDSLLNSIISVSYTHLTLPTRDFV